jgi:hypothetical protein
MSTDVNPRSTREMALAALSRLIGLPLTGSHRAADMRIFQFGKLRSAVSKSPKRKPRLVGDWALHIQCPWRIDRPEGIITGRMDLWLSPDGEYLPDDLPHGDELPNLQDVQVQTWLEQNASSLIVKSVDADQHGGGSVEFVDGSAIRFFPAGKHGEDWRLFRPGSDEHHFVITGGAVESDMT